MPEFTVRHTVPHSVRNMFDLVADVEKYPQFVPLCQSLRVRGRQTIEPHRTLLVADMTAAYGPVHETFTTRVTLDEQALTINVVYLDGPFRHLDNRWSFVAAEAGSCAVEFFISYEFKSRMLAALMGTIFDKAFRRFIDAFERRADEIYRAPAIDTSN